MFLRHCVCVGVGVFALDLVSQWYPGTLLEECNTSVTKSQRSSAGIPSMQRQASEEITSDSVGV